MKPPNHLQDWRPRIVRLLEDGPTRGSSRGGARHALAYRLLGVARPHSTLGDNVALSDNVAIALDGLGHFENRFVRK